MSFQNIDEIEDSLKPGGNPSVRDLYNIWHQRLPVIVIAKRDKSAPVAVSSAPQLQWLQSDLSLVTDFAEQALHKEEYLLVRDLYDEAIIHWQKEAAARPAELLRSMVKLKCQYARAQMRLGFNQEARNILEPLTAHRDLGRKERARILLLLGHILRESAHHQSTKAAQGQIAEEALDCYQRAQQEDATLLEAIVLKTAMTFLLSENQPGRRREAEQEARELLPLIEEMEQSGGAAFQSISFRAATLCVLGRTDEAAENYTRLQTVPGVTTADLAEARYRSQFLAEALGKSRDFFKQAFPALQLVVFAGHIPDLPNRPIRFPDEAIPAVREMLQKKLEEMQARVGLVSAAAGADLLFIEALLNRPGSKYHLVLPWSQDEFYRTSIEPFEPKDQPPVWKPLFDRALENAATVRELGQVFQPGGDVGWEFTQEVTAGLALLTARVSRLDVQPMALWDGQAGYGAGGTSSFVNLWRGPLQLPPMILKLPARETPEESLHHRNRPRIEHETMHQEVKTILFADIVGYSKLTEKVIRNFVEQFMHRLSVLVATDPNAPCHISTWGDAVYGVFDFSHQAGLFALTLTRMIRDGEKEWIKNGLFYEEYDPEKKEMVRRPLNIRIGLHTGPVLAAYNPVIRQLTYTGSHVSRAARIEPVASPGEVYASEEFAAMSELSAEINRRNPEGASGNGDGFVCEYAGSMPLAKNYPGRFRIYRLSPQRAFAMEELAKAAHDLYCAEQVRQGKTLENTPALRPWSELPEDLRDANRAQVADIPNKLYFLGYELASGHGLPPAEIVINPEQLELMAEREHERWMRQRLRNGWTLGPRDDDPRKKLHPDLIPYRELSESTKQKDRDAVMNLFELIAKAGYRVRKLSQGA